MSTPASTHRRHLRADDGVSLVEVLVAMALGTLVMGVTFNALMVAIRANETVTHITSVNNSLRAAMDLMVRDFLQVGSGLPPGHVINIPTGANAEPVRLPGPPNTNFTTNAGDTDIAAVLPGTGLGPVINGVATDIITVLMADNTFSDVGLTNVGPSSVKVVPSVNIGAGPDRVVPGQLMMISKGSLTALVQVSTVNPNSQLLTFTPNDSLNLNQPPAVEGSLGALNAAAPANNADATRITRIRMITYYIDATTSPRPRLMRRINNGDPNNFDNTLGTAVGLDIENLQISYDLADGATNPANVRFTDADLNGTGACAPSPCAPTQIRKINVALTARSNNVGQPGTRVVRNTLSSQVSLRGMAFLNEYQQP